MRYVRVIDGKTALCEGHDLVYMNVDSVRIESVGIGVVVMWTAVVTWMDKYGEMVLLAEPGKRVK